MLQAAKYALILFLIAIAVLIVLDTLTCFGIIKEADNVTAAALFAILIFEK